MTASAVLHIAFCPDLLCVNVFNHLKVAHLSANSVPLLASLHLQVPRIRSQVLGSMHLCTSHNAKPPCMHDLVLGFIFCANSNHLVCWLCADSEHSAIFQCIQGLPENGLRRIILTASGGAFRDWPVEKLESVKVRMTLSRFRNLLAGCSMSAPS